MTRMHFEMIAAIIKDAKIDPKARSEIVSEFCHRLKAINPNFNAARFCAACKP